MEDIVKWMNKEDWRNMKVDKDDEEKANKNVLS